MKAVKMEEIVQVLFPSHAIRADIVAERESIEQCTIFTVRELKEVDLFMKDLNPPGSDNFPSELLKLLLKYNSNLLLTVSTYG